MGMIIRFQDHARATSGHKSGRSSPRETPVAVSMRNTNSAGAPRLDRESQYQTWDCVVPMRSAKGFCPPAKTHARLSASLDMGAQYPFLGRLQPKNLCKTADLDFGRLEPMKEANPIEFGNRVRERRKALGLSQKRLGELSGYSQTNIGWIEMGTMKRPQRSAAALSDVLRSPVDYLLWGIGPKEIGPAIMSNDELRENYNFLSPEDQAAISADIAQRIEAYRQKQKIV